MTMLITRKCAQKKQNVPQKRKIERKKNKSLFLWEKKNVIYSAATIQLLRLTVSKKWLIYCYNYKRMLYILIRECKYNTALQQSTFRIAQNIRRHSQTAYVRRLQRACMTCFISEKKIFVVTLLCAHIHIYRNRMYSRTFCGAKISKKNDQYFWR